MFCFVFFQNFFLSFSSFYKKNLFSCSLFLFFFLFSFCLIFFSFVFSCFLLFSLVFSCFLFFFFSLLFQSAHRNGNKQTNDSTPPTCVSLLSLAQLTPVPHPVSTLCKCRTLSRCPQQVSPDRSQAHVAHTTH